VGILLLNLEGPGTTSLTREWQTGVPAWGYVLTEITSRPVNPFSPLYSFIQVKLKVKFNPEQATKSHKGSSSIAVLGVRWGG